MTLDITKFNKVVETAKAKTSDKRWQNAIDKAQAGIVSGWWIVTELHDSVAITTESGQTYFANGTCSCPAYNNGQPCKHRALARLIDLYHEEEKSSVTTKVTEAPSRSDLINDIEKIWKRVMPHLPLATELLARFGKSHLQMLDDDMLRRVRLAISM